MRKKNKKKLTTTEYTEYTELHRVRLSLHTKTSVFLCVLRGLLFFSFFLTISFFCYAQNTEPYLIPRNIYIGDAAKYILPLSASDQNKTDIILTSGKDKMPFHPNIDFHKIILEQKTTGSRLIIDFTPFLSGLIEFPDIEISGEIFSGLTVTVNSMIKNETTPILSGAASALAIPGTAFIIYSALAVIVLIIILTIIFVTKGRTLFKFIKEKWKRFRLFSVIRKTERNLFKSINNNEDGRVILDKLSDEFRNFLSFITNTNCSSMTSNEFKKMPTETFFTNEDIPSFLYKFFHKCDEIRFSGIKIDTQKILPMLNDLRWFIDLMDNATKNNKKEKPA